MNDARTCRCPVRPYYAPGSLGAGSVVETESVKRWVMEHASHPYAQARDDLARSLQFAESRVGSGEAVLDMVADVFGLPRVSSAPTLAGEAVREASRRNARLAAEAHPGGEYTTGEPSE